VMLITTSPRWNLKKVVRRALRLRSSSGDRFSWSYVLPTLEVCRWGLTTPPCRPSLHSLNFADVLGGVRVPDTASVFQNWADKCFVRLIFGVNGPDLQCPSQEVEGLVGFVDHVHDVGVPTQVFRNGDSQVLNLPGVVEGMAVKLGCSCSLRLSPCACAVVLYVAKKNA